MKLIIQVSNNRVIERLREFGNVLYELKSLDAVVLDVSENQRFELIQNLPGVISMKKEEIGSLMTI